MAAFIGKKKDEVQVVSTDKLFTVELIWRMLNFTMCVFFSLATLVNLNDRTWYMWVPIYSVPTLLCLATTITPNVTNYHPWQAVTVAHCSMCVCYILYLTFNSTAISSVAVNQTNPLNSADGRDMCGLIIVVSWLAWSLLNPFMNCVTDHRLLLTTLVLLTLVAAILPLFVWSLCYINPSNVKFGHCK